MQAINRNENLHTLLFKATGIEPTWTSDMRANPFGWLILTKPAQLEEVAKALAGKARLATVTAYSEGRDDPEKRRRIAYHFISGDTILTVTVPLYHPTTMQKLAVPSITPWFRNADWNEREFMEMFNIEITGHPNPRRLFLDERLDAGIMTSLIPFSAMANSAGTNTLWERILEAKGVPPEDRLPSVSIPAEPIKVEPSVSPVNVEAKPAAAKPVEPATLADIAASAEKAMKQQEPAAQKPAPAAAPEAAGAVQTQLAGTDAQPAAAPAPVEHDASEAKAKPRNKPAADEGTVKKTAPARQKTAAPKTREAAPKTAPAKKAAVKKAGAPSSAKSAKSAAKAGPEKPASKPKNTGKKTGAAVKKAVRSKTK